LLNLCVGGVVKPMAVPLNQRMPTGKPSALRTSGARSSLVL
jgi:hypothetical protein